MNVTMTVPLRFSRRIWTIFACRLRRRKRNIGGRYPRPGSSDAARFRGFSQFERICWHWSEINRVALEALERLPPDRSLFARLEDLRESPSDAAGLYDFLNLPYQEANFSLFARPHNVNRPEDRLLDVEQRDAFEAIAGGMQARLGYADRPEYVVNY